MRNFGTLERVRSCFRRVNSFRLSFDLLRPYQLQQQAKEFIEWNHISLSELNWMYKIVFINRQGCESAIRMLQLCFTKLMKSLPLKTKPIQLSIYRSMKLGSRISSSPTNFPYVRNLNFDHCSSEYKTFFFVKPLQNLLLSFNYSFSPSIGKIPHTSPRIAKDLYFD